MENPRIKHLNDHETKKGLFILYWMQASQRTLHNHALYHAVDLANSMNLPVMVYFGLKEDYPEANERHFKFMLEGLKEVADSLREIGIQLIIRKEEPWEGALQLSKEAAEVVCDKGYLRHQIEWRRKIAMEAQCKVVEVETDVIIPVETDFFPAKFCPVFRHSSPVTESDHGDAVGCQGPYHTIAPITQIQYYHRSQFTNHRHLL